MCYNSMLIHKYSTEMNLMEDFNGRLIENKQFNIIIISIVKIDKLNFKLINTILIIPEIKREFKTKYTMYQYCKLQ